MKTATRLILRDMLPMAFASEPERHSASDIWLKPGMEFIPGERYLVRSESGGGKSSLCSYLHGNRDDYSGTLMIGDRDARHLSVRDWTTLRRETLAYLPQDMGLFPALTAIENVRLKNRLTNHKTEEEIMEMLDTVGVGHLADRPRRETFHRSTTARGVGQDIVPAILHPVARRTCQPSRQRGQSLHLIACRPGSRREKRHSYCHLCRQ